jgi:2-C-methyl-D-erythritol 2,4-cyclodiphosphate synthase
LAGHSDADALLHAICDALLGAACMGDIGTHFPDTDPRYKDCSSLHLLEEIIGRLQESGLAVHNIDATVLADRPIIAPFRDEMRAGIARACGVATEQVSIKATTQEGLGFVGAGSGIAAHAIALLEPYETNEADEPWSSA